MSMLLVRDKWKGVGELKLYENAEYGMVLDDMVTDRASVCPIRIRRTYRALKKICCYHDIEIQYHRSIAGLGGYQPRLEDMTCRLTFG